VGVVFSALRADAPTRVILIHLPTCIAPTQISIRTERVRVREGTGRAALLQRVENALAGGGGGVGAAAAGTGEGAGAAGGGVGVSVGAGAPIGRRDEADTLAATSAQPELPFPVVLEMAEAVVKHCTALPAGGVLGSAFKAAFRAFHGRELQLKFLGQRVQLKDILERSRVVERVTVNTQPLYRCECVVARAGRLTPSSGTYRVSTPPPSPPM